MGRSSVTEEDLEPPAKEAVREPGPGSFLGSAPDSARPGSVAGPVLLALSLQFPPAAFPGQPARGCLASLLHALANTLELERPGIRPNQCGRVNIFFLK